MFELIAIVITQSPESVLRIILADRCGEGNSWTDDAFDHGIRKVGRSVGCVWV